MAQRFLAGDMVNVVTPGAGNLIGVLIEEVQGYSVDGLIFEPEHPEVIGWQYIIGGLAYDEQYLHQ